MNWAYPTAVAAILLSGCAGAPPKRAEVPPQRATAPPAAGIPMSAPPQPSARARDGGHIGACRDGTCEVTVRSGAKIPLAHRFGMGPITVTVNGDDVGLQTHSPDTDTNDTVTAPGTVTLNDITVDVIETHDNTATLRVSHH